MWTYSLPIKIHVELADMDHNGTLSALVWKEQSGWKKKSLYAFQCLEESQNSISHHIRKVKAIRAWKAALRLPRLPSHTDFTAWTWRAWRTCLGYYRELDQKRQVPAWFQGGRLSSQRESCAPFASLSSQSISAAVTKEVVCIKTWNTANEMQ